MSKGGALDSNGLTVKKEAFAQLMATNQYTQSDAYREVYSTENMKPEMVHKRASEIANEEKVKGRIEELRKTAEDIFRENQEAMAQSIVDAATKAEKVEGLPDYGVRSKAAKDGLEFIIPKKSLNLNANVNRNMTKEEVDDLLKGL